MKISLIQPYYFNVWEGLGPAYMGANLKKNFSGKLSINFFQGYFDTDEEILAGVKGSDLVGFSCTSPTWKHAVSLATKIKKINPKVRIVVGGWHPSAVPEDCLAHECIDQVVVGEGEMAMLSIVNGNNDPIIYGSQLPSLNELLPDRELIRSGRTIDLSEKMTGTRITSFQSCRVCPFKCVFCAERIVTGRFHRQNNPVRERDPAHLLDEIVQVGSDYSLDYFKFVDATWNTSPEKVIAFCEEKISRNFTMPWEANIHATFVNKEMLQIMQRANCHQINVGCESGSQKILNNMGKGLRIEQVERVFSWAREAGLERRAFFLLGMPNETVEDIKKTEALVERIQPEVFGITILCPYPGSDLYNTETMKGYDWSTTDEYSNNYWSTAHLSNQDMHHWQKYLSEKFSSSLSWHNKVLSENSLGYQSIEA